MKFKHDETLFAMNDTSIGSPQMYTVPLPDGFNSTSDDAGKVHEWLVAHDFDVISVSVGVDALYVESIDDPTELLITYTSGTTHKEQLLAELDTLDLEDIDGLKTAVGILKSLIS